MEKQIHIIEVMLKPEEIDTEDSGQAKIFTCCQDEEDNGMYVRICSWDENKIHSELDNFVGRKIKITIETID